MVVLFMKLFLEQLMEWLNQFIRLRNLDTDPITLADMYRYVAVLLLSHTNGFSFGKTIYVLRKTESTIPSVERMRFIADNILAYSATGRGTDG